MKVMWLVMAFFLAGSVHAETKVLKLGNVDCPDCAATLKDKLCVGTDYETCDVKLINKKRKLGQVKLVTKGDKKIDIVKVTKIIEDEGYVIKK